MSKRVKTSRRKDANQMESLLKQIVASTASAKQSTPSDEGVELFYDLKKYDNNVVTCFDSYEVPSAFASSTTLNSSYSLAIQASSLANFTDMSAGFDQYRIKAVQVQFYPHLSAIIGTSNTGLITSVIDYDDANPLSTVSDALGYSNQCTVSGYTPFTRTFEPRLAVAAYSGVFTNYKNEKADWIDCSSSGVAHYGVKTIWTPTDAVYRYDVIVRVLIQYRNTR